MGKALILVVDDRAANLKLSRALLEREGYSVLTATNAESALELLQSQKPRLVLMDIRLPGMDGLTLTRRLKAEPRDTGHHHRRPERRRGQRGRGTSPCCRLRGLRDEADRYRVLARGRGPPAREGASDAMSTLPILIVEDNAATLKMMRVALQAEGHTVIEAENGESALRLAAEHLPSIVLLDCGLPDMDGFEVARRLRAIAPHLGVIAVTGWMVADDVRVLSAGFLDVLVKPVEPSRLAQVVERHVGRAPPRSVSAGAAGSLGRRRSGVAQARGISPCPTLGST